MLHIARWAISSSPVGWKKRLNGLFHKLCIQVFILGRLILECERFSPSDLQNAYKKCGWVWRLKSLEKSRKVKILRGMKIYKKIPFNHPKKKKRKGYCKGVRDNRVRFLLLSRWLNKNFRNKSSLLEVVRKLPLGRCYHPITRLGCTIFNWLQYFIS